VAPPDIETLNIITRGMINTMSRPEAAAGDDIIIDMRRVSIILIGDGVVAR